MDYLTEYRRMTGVGPSLMEKAAGDDRAMLDILSTAFSTKVAPQDIRYITFKKSRDSIEMEDKAEWLGGILTSVESEEVDLDQFAAFLKKHGAKPSARKTEAIHNIFAPGPETTGESDADKLCKKIEAEVKGAVGDRFLQCRVDTRFGGGTVFVDYANVPSTTTPGSLAFLNAKVQLRVLVHGFSATGQFVKPKAKAELLTKHGVDFRAKTGTLDQVAAHIIASVKKAASVQEALGAAAFLALGDQSDAEDETSQLIIKSFKKSVKLWTDYLEALTGTSWKADIGELTVDFNEAFGKKRSVGIYWDADVGSDHVTFYVEGPKGTGTKTFPRKFASEPTRVGAPKEFFAWIEKELREALELDRRGRLTESDVGRTILQQFGGGRALMMIGGKALLLPNGVGIKWPNKKRSKGNYVEITLRPDDTYDMEFFNLQGASKKSVQKYEGIYADSLQELFEKQTGWYLSLGKMKSGE